MLAAKYNPNPEVIRALIEAGADAGLKDNAGKTAWNYAQDNFNIKGTSVYWELNDKRF